MHGLPPDRLAAYFTELLIEGQFKAHGIINRNIFIVDGHIIGLREMYY